MTACDYTPIKKCAKCKSFLPHEMFYNNRSKSDGLTTECKSCAKTASLYRYASDVKLSREKMRANYLANKDAYIARARKWERENPERKKELKAIYRENNREKLKEISRLDWVKHNEKRLARKKEYRAANPERGAEHVRARQTRKQRAMPIWSNRDAILAIYAECRRISEATGIKHHVDHFYPLKGVMVSGLHNEFNLRVIPAKENQSKGNRLIG